MILLASALAVGAFLIAFKATNIVGRAKSATAIARSALAVMQDKSLSDAQKEKATQKAAVSMLKASFGIAFREAERPGVYFRVLNGGEVAAGDSVTFIETEESDVTILELFRFSYARQHDADALRRLLEAPLAERMRAKVEGKLAALG